MLGFQKYHILQNPRLKKCQVVRGPQRQNPRLPWEQIVGEAMARATRGQELVWRQEGRNGKKTGLMERTVGQEARVRGTGLPSCGKIRPHN